MPFFFLLVIFNQNFFGENHFGNNYDTNNNNNNNHASFENQEYSESSIRNDALVINTIMIKAKVSANC